MLSKPSKAKFGAKRAIRNIVHHSTAAKKSGVNLLNRHDLFATMLPSDPEGARERQHLDDHDGPTCYCHNYAKRIGASQDQRRYLEKLLIRERQLIDLGMGRGKLPKHAPNGFHITFDWSESGLVWILLWRWLVSAYSYYAA